MSVINQMLKDLDKRQSEQDDPGVDYPKITEPPAKMAAPNKRFWLLLGMIVLIIIIVTGSGIAHWLTQPKSIQPNALIAESNNSQASSQITQTTPDGSVARDVNRQQNTTHSNKTLVPAVALQATSKNGLKSTNANQNTTQNTTQNSIQSSNTQAALKTTSTVNTSSNTSENKPTQPNNSSANTTAAVESTTTNNKQVVTNNGLDSINNQQKTPNQAATVNANKASNQQDKRFMSINPTRQSPPKIAANKLEQAKALLDKGQFVKAEQLLQSALTLQPELHEARITWMSIRYGEQNLPAALAVLQQGIKSYPQHLPYRLLAARILLEMNKPDIAWTLIENQQPTTDTNTGFYQFKASLAQQLNLTKQALQNWQILLSINPTQASWQLGAAIAAEQAKRPEQAIIHYQKAFNLGGLSKASRQFIQQKLASLQP